MKSSEQRSISLKTGSNFMMRKNNNRNKTSKTFKLTRNLRKIKKLIKSSRKVKARAEVEVKAIKKSECPLLEEKWGKANNLVVSKEIIQGLQWSSKIWSFVRGSFKCKGKKPTLKQGNLKVKSRLKKLEQRVRNKRTKNWGGNRKKKLKQLRWLVTDWKELTTINWWEERKRKRNKTTISSMKTSETKI